MLRAALLSFCLVAATAAGGLGATPASTAAAPVVYTVFVGPGNTIYSIVPGPTPGAVPDPTKVCGLSFDAPSATAVHPAASAFADGTMIRTGASPGATTCQALALAPSAAGLNVEFVLSYLTVPPAATPVPLPSPTPSASPLPSPCGRCFTSLTPVDNVAQGRLVDRFSLPEDVLRVTVSVAPCDDDTCTNPKPAHTLVYLINPDLHVYATDAVAAGVPQLIIPTPPSAIDAGSLAKTVNVELLNDGRTPVWAGSLPIPWSTLNLGNGRSSLQISVDVIARDPDPHAVPTARTSNNVFDNTSVAGGGAPVYIDVRSAFAPPKPTPSPQAQPAISTPTPQPTLAADATQRYAVATWIAQYDETRFAAAQPPASGNFTPPVQAPPAAAFPRVAGDANLPLSRQILLGLTVDQNNTKPSSLQKSIVANTNAALPQATISPSFKCGTCQTFQDLYGAPFGLDTASAKLSALGSAKVGQDELPYNLSKVGDLDVGHSSTYTNGSLKLGVQDVFGSSAPQAYGFGFTHHVAGLSYSSGPFTASGVYVSANAGVPSLSAARLAAAVPTPAPSVTPLFTNPAAPLHVTDFALSLANDNVWTTASGNAEVAAVVRNSFDLTDRTSSGFAGSQYTVTNVATSQRAYQFQAAGGFRWSDVRYNTLAGDAVTFPAVGGGTASVAYSRKSYGRAQPSLAIGAYRLSNENGDGVSSIDSKLGYDFSPIWGVSFETSNVRISEPLLAIQGDPTLRYPAADSAIIDFRTGTRYAGKPRFAPLEDNTVALTVKDPQALLFGKTIPVNVSIGYDFFRRTASCTQSPITGLYACSQDPRSSVITAAGSITIDKFTIAGSYVPSTSSEGSQRVASRDRIYNIFVGAKFSDCVTAVVTASNDTQTLFSSILPIKRSFGAELDIQRPFLLDKNANPALADLATVVVGYGNTDSFTPSLNAISTGTGFIRRLFPTRQDTLYLKVRLGTRPFKQTLAPNCTYAPAPKAPATPK